MKKICLVLILLSAFSAYSLEFGFLFNDTFSPENQMTLSDVTWTNYTSLYGWIGHDFTKNIGIIASGTVKLEFTPDNISYKLYFGNTALKLRFDNLFAGSSIDSSIGRVRVADTAGTLFNGFMDGATLSWFINGMRLRVFAAYTGFILDSELELTKTDANVQNPNLIFSTAYEPRRVVSGVGLSNIPVLKKHLSFSAELLGDFDVDTGDKTHVQYASASALYTAVPGMVYVSGFLIGSVAEHAAGVHPGFAAGLSADIIFQTAVKDLRDRLFLKAKFASGPSISVFYPVLYSSTAVSVELPFTGLTQFQLGNALRKGNFNVTAAVSAYLRDPKQVIAEYGALDNGQIYTGSEVTLGLSWAPLADLQLNLTGACFIPGAVFVLGTSPRWSAGAGLTFSF